MQSAIKMTGTQAGSKPKNSDKITANNFLRVQQFLCRNAGAGTLEKSAFSLAVAKMFTKTLTIPKKGTCLNQRKTGSEYAGLLALRAKTQRWENPIRA